MGTGEQADQGIELAMLADGTKLGISQLVLPGSGILYMGDHSELGGEPPAPWQCAARPDGAEDVLFRPQWQMPNFFDHANWHILNPGGGGNVASGWEEAEDNNDDDIGIWLLDAQRVPSAEDDVLVPKWSASKMFLEVPATMHSLNFSGRLLSNVQLHAMPYTVEGQFWLRLGSQLGLDFPQDGRYQFRWPIKAILSLADGDANGAGNERKRQMAMVAALQGRPNSNFFEPQFSSLCQFVHCVPVEAYCTEPIRPVGQCCAQCGAKLQFRQNSLNFTLTQTVVRSYGQLAVHAQWIPQGTGISFVRIDTNDFHPLYQLSILGENPAEFEESQFCSMLWAMFQKIQQRGVNVHLAHVDYQPTTGADYFDLQAQCSAQKGILRWRDVARWMFLLGAIAAIGMLAFRVEYRRNARLRLIISEYWNPSIMHASSSLPVRWQRTVAEEERVEMAIGGGTEEGTTTDLIVDTDGEAEVSERRTAATHFLAEFVNRAFLFGVAQQHKQTETTNSAGGTNSTMDDHQLRGGEVEHKINDEKVENLLEI